MVTSAHKKMSESKKSKAFLVIILCMMVVISIMLGLKLEKDYLELPFGILSTLILIYFPSQGIPDAVTAWREGSSAAGEQPPANPIS